LSKVVTVGSEFQLAAADYLNWFASDDATRAIGVVAESIKDPVAFALAAERLHAAGKALVVLKVGNSEMGSLATQAHTGALVSSRDAFDDFFEDCDIATVRDYDELVASLEAAVVAKRMVRGSRIAIAGISGGQTALACDVAAARGIALAEFAPDTRDRVHQALPGSSGVNPVDIGATVQQQDRNAPLAFAAILEDPAVGALALLQDCQASLNPRTYENYMLHIPGYGQIGNTTGKPVVMVSPTGESIHAGIAEAIASTPVPIVRGLVEGLVAIRNLGCGHRGHAQAWAHAHRADRPASNPAALQWRERLATVSGNLPPATCFEILRSYGVPVVRSTIVATAQEALDQAAAIGFPMVVKVASRQISHRSDVGGVVLAVQDGVALQAAIASIARNVAVSAPQAVIDGYELQEQIVGDAEVLVGFTAAPPFGSLMVVGTGGTMVELHADRAVSLAPLTAEKARDKLRTTRVGKLLAGYRNLLPQTDLGPLARLIQGVSDMAMDLGDRISACDLNPVLVKKGTGEVRVVDALMLVREPDAHQT
ncbi:MAG: acetate--CoA ligase family protein, partial [Burkholderiaceae bacterium]